MSSFLLNDLPPPPPKATVLSQSLTPSLHAPSLLVPQFFQVRKIPDPLTRPPPLLVPQFCQALTLMEVARRSGGRLPSPATAAAGGPPLQQQMGAAPVAASAAAVPHAPWSLQSQFGERASAQVSNAPQAPTLPAFPQRFDYEEPEAAGAQPPSRVPVAAAAVVDTFADIERWGFNV